MAWALPTSHLPPSSEYAKLIPASKPWPVLPLGMLPTWLAGFSPHWSLSSNVCPDLKQQHCTATNPMTPFYFLHSSYHIGHSLVYLPQNEAPHTEGLCLLLCSCLPHSGKGLGYSRHPIVSTGFKIKPISSDWIPHGKNEKEPCLFNYIISWTKVCQWKALTAYILDTNEFQA